MSMLEAVPAKLEGLLDPAWLTGALYDLGDGERVVDARAVDSMKTIASKVRFEAVVEGPDGTRRTRHYCVKGGFDDDGSTGAILALEARVYRELAPVVGLRVPYAAYAETEEGSGRSVIVLEDLVAAEATFLNALTPYSLETVRGTLGQLAQLHAATWGQEGMARFSWLPPRMDVRMPIDMLQGLLDDGRGPDLPPYLRDAETVTEAMARGRDEAPVCVAHGDAHSGNAYVDRDGQAGWYDWQCAHRGHWATDVSYHLGTALDIETRRRHEADLLRFYLDELARHGVEPPAWDDAWEDYALHFAYGYYLWAITRFHNRAVVVEHIPRLGTAIVDHDTYARLGIETG